MTTTLNSTKRSRKAVEPNPFARIVTRRRDRAVVYSLLLLMAIMFAFPLYALVSRSFQYGGWSNYTSLFTNPIGDVPVLLTYVNSLAIGAVHAALVVFVSTTAGYALSKVNFRGRELTFSGVVLFLAVPGVAILVPVYYITQQLSLFNNYVGVGLPEAALTIPFGVLLMRNYGKNIPNELNEAGQLDGANHYRIFWHVFLPLSRPAVANLTILCFIWSLQDFLWPSMLFTNPRMASAAQAVKLYSNVLGQSPEDYGRYNAALVLLAIPAVIFVVFGLRFIVNGLTSGATKG